ncbi:hypothetical protein AMTRI_Chr10g227120 [Amborella trichopoda]|uniref:EF-hand domain-containing protein n=1 Tax=Amborella trichopoda TaxID=13333 RepID=U5CWN2_AMBTC|nr:two pore potassium channel a [Amborella trichopoda]XP_011627791.1 two pore potassium channel a [Amborella trichopoda]XP_011627792.1 two pore potassium channel a [Amborella trichopoda]XP_020530481.1 two pore potassium channel a [Amborella trichopoda]XP_020530482.1 two pore potassium channel a [Amborella trichopoda]ERN17751.1 hypothetical protein AMTR_s00047p00085560 [Amborella trichopoda]|eukprot:XP_006856284.1 two pore potassium channel a [Amborella trichopoda]
MIQDSTAEPLLSDVNDPNASNIKKPRINRGKYRRCKSAPSVDAFLVPGKNGMGLNPLKGFGKYRPTFCHVFIFLAFYLGIGTLCFCSIKHEIGGKKTNAILDAIYFCVVTMTTVGYGDLVPETITAKLLACAFVFTGMAMVGLILSSAADYLVEKQETLVVEAICNHQKVGFNEMIKEMEINRVKYKLLTVGTILTLLIIVGTVFLVKVEGLSFVDSFYCVCSTITTLGYGDKSFSSQGGRIFAVFWILTSTLCVAQFFLYITEMYTEKKQRHIAHKVLKTTMASSDLEAADLDADGVLGPEEFALYMLKKMGKISQEDLVLVMAEFEKLDVDRSGTISISDLEDFRNL